MLSKRCFIMEKVGGSEIIVITFLSIISQIPQAYVATEIGITTNDELIVIASLSLTIFGLIIFATVLMDYLRGRILEKHPLQTPFLAAATSFVIQYLLFIWLFSELSKNMLFLNNSTSLFVFSQMVSILIPLSAIALLSREPEM